MRISIIIAGILAANMAHARMPADPVAPTGGPATSTSAANAAAVADASQMQGQAQGQQQLSTSAATGGDALGIGLGGDGGAGGGGGQGTGVAGAGASVTMNGARQVGMLYAPAVIPPQCGVSASAGHSNTGNAAFLGFSFTTGRCYSIVTAVDLERMGAYREACELRRDVVRGQLKRINKKRIKAGLPPMYIDCEQVERDLIAAIATAAIPEPQLPAPDYATREELRRAFEAASGKVVK